MMPYQLRYTPRAEADLDRVPSGLLDKLEEHLQRLAEDPAGLSRPSAFPFPPDCQLSQFHCKYFDDLRYHFTVLFRYGADETTLQILGVVCQEVAPDYPFLDDPEE
jgi:hypothetical protein